MYTHTHTYTDTRTHTHTHTHTRTHTQRLGRDGSGGLLEPSNEIAAAERLKVRGKRVPTVAVVLVDPRDLIAREKGHVDKLALRAWVSGI